MFNYRRFYSNVIVSSNTHETIFINDFGFVRWDYHKIIAASTHFKNNQIFESFNHSVFQVKNSNFSGNAGDFTKIDHGGENKVRDTKNRVCDTRNNDHDTKNNDRDTENNVHDTENNDRNTENNISDTEIDVRDTRNNVHNTKNNACNTKFNFNKTLTANYQHDNPSYKIK